jgi:MFS transporter, UMF1 family
MEDGHVTGSQRAARRRTPRYDGEDLSPTTTRELRGFYAYSLAAEVFAVCGVGKDLMPRSDNFSSHSAQVHFYP